jgi:hypothetical protein
MNNCFFILIIILVLVFILFKTRREKFTNVKDIEYDKINELSRKLLLSVKLDEYSPDDLTLAVINDDFNYILSKVKSEDKKKLNQLFISINTNLLKRLYNESKIIY